MCRDQERMMGVPGIMMAVRGVLLVKPERVHRGTIIRNSTSRILGVLPSRYLDTYWIDPVSEIPAATTNNTAIVNTPTEESPSTASEGVIISIQQ